MRKVLLQAILDNWENTLTQSNYPSANSLSDPRDIVEFFGMFFESVFVKVDLSTCPQELFNYHINISLPVVSETVVFN